MMLAFVFVRVCNLHHCFQCLMSLLPSCAPLFCFSCFVSTILSFTRFHPSHTSPIGYHLSSLSPAPFSSGLLCRNADRDATGVHHLDNRRRGEFFRDLWLQVSREWDKNETQTQIPADFCCIFLAA